MEKPKTMDILQLPFGDFLGRLKEIDQPFKKNLKEIIKEFRNKTLAIEGENNGLPFLDIEPWDDKNIPKDLAENHDKYLYDK